MVAYDLEYFNHNQSKEIDELAKECGKTLNGWMKSQKEFIKT